MLGAYPPNANNSLAAGAGSMILTGEDEMIDPRVVPVLMLLVLALTGCERRAAVDGDDWGVDGSSTPDMGVPTPWATALGGSTLARGNGIAWSAGRCHVAGTRSSSARGEDVLLSRVARGGAQQWTLEAGGALRDAASDVAVDPQGNSLITGIYSVNATFGSTTLSSVGKNDIFVARVSAAGKPLWVVSAGGTSGEHGAAVATDASGNAYITGSFSGVAKFGNLGITALGKEDVFVAKIGSDGSFVWAVSMGGSSGDYGADIAVDPDGRLYVTGYFASKASFGKTLLTSRGQLDLFVARLDAAGDVQWATSGGGVANDRGLGVAVDKAGVTVVGDFLGVATFGKTKLKATGMTDVLVARLEPTGAFAWAKKGGGGGNDSGTGVATDAGGRAMVTGYFQKTATFGAYSLTSTGGYDLFVVPVSNSGALSKAEAAGGVKDDYGHDVVIDGAGASYITGSFQGKATFGKTALTASGAEDIFVWSLGR